MSAAHTSVPYEPVFVGATKQKLEALYPKYPTKQACLLPALWMFFLMRNFASTHPYSAGSIALLSAFSMGALSLRLTESTDSIMHVVQWHYLPMVVAGVLGLWLGKKFLKW